MQRFDLYGTKSTYGTAQTTGDVGTRFGKLLVPRERQLPEQQQPAAGVRDERVVPDRHDRRLRRDRTSSGASANVLGATGLLHTGMTNAKIKAAYDLTPTIRAAYTFGFWKNDADSDVDPFIDESGQPTFAGQAGFASGFYKLDAAAHVAQPVAAQRYAAHVGLRARRHDRTTSARISSGRRRRRRRTI